MIEQTGWRGKTVERVSRGTSLSPVPFQIGQEGEEQSKVAKNEES